MVGSERRKRWAVRIAFGTWLLLSLSVCPLPFATCENRRLLLHGIIINGQRRSMTDGSIRFVVVVCVVAVFQSVLVYGLIATGERWSSGERLGCCALWR